MPGIDPPFFVEREGARIDFGEIENIVDNREQVFPALVNELGIFRLAGSSGSATPSSSASEKPMIALSGVRSS